MHVVSPDMSQLARSHAQGNCVFHLEAGNRDKGNATSKLFTVFVGAELF